MPRGPGERWDGRGQASPLPSGAQDWRSPGSLADTLATLVGLLLVVQGRLKASVRAQLDVHAQGVVEEAAGTELVLAAAPVSTQDRRAVAAHLADLVSVP